MIEQIIFAEDDPGIRKYMGLAIASLGYPLSLAENGEIAYGQFIEQLSFGKIPLVLTDISMPILDGVGLAKRIRENHEDLKTTIIALTGWASTLAPQSREQFNEILSKPVRIQTLEQTLAKYAKEITI